VRLLALALVIAASLAVPRELVAAIPLARRLADTSLARDLVEGRGAPTRAALEASGEEVPLDLHLEAEVEARARWARDRFELVRARSATGDDNLLAFDHRGRRWWRLDATRKDNGPLQVRRSPDGRVVLTRSFLQERPTFSAFLLGPQGLERLARFQVPWGDLDRDILRRIHEGGLEVTSPDTHSVAFTTLDRLEVGPDGPLVRLRGTAYLGRRDAFRQALRQADPTLGLTAREIFLTKDWLPPGTMPVVLQIERERVWVTGVGALEERMWSEPEPSPGTWRLMRPRAAP
jgi:hypothetical protein